MVSRVYPLPHLRRLLTAKSQPFLSSDESVLLRKHALCYRSLTYTRSSLLELRLQPSKDTSLRGHSYTQELEKHIFFYPNAKHLCCRDQRSVKKKSRFQLCEATIDTRSTSPRTLEARDAHTDKKSHRLCREAVPCWPLLSTCPPPSPPQA